MKFTNHELTQWTITEIIHISFNQGACESSTQNIYFHYLWIKNHQRSNKTTQK